MNNLDSLLMRSGIHGSEASQSSYDVHVRAVGNDGDKWFIRKPPFDFVQFALEHLLSFTSYLLPITY